MAYIEEIKVYRCQGRGCTAKATVEVYAEGGTSMGFYCIPHGRTVANKRVKVEIQIADARDRMTEKEKA